MSPDDGPHGTAKNYKGGCRCDDCRRAQAQHQQRWLMGQTGNLVDSTGTHRRIQALSALGWSYAEIASACGVTSKEWARDVMKYGRVHTDTAKRVSDAYELMSMTIPTGPTRKRARLWAERKGWPPPLAWDNIDDPNERPADWQYIGFNREEVLADLDDRGESLTAACRVLGISPDGVERWCQRHGYNDLYRRLVERERPHHWANQYGEGGAA